MRSVFVTLPLALVTLVVAGCGGKSYGEAQPRPEAETGQPRFIPYDVPPTLQNTAEVERLMQEAHTAELEDAGVGGVTQVWLNIDESGWVKNVVLKETSGYAELDEAALRIAWAMRFSPARNRDAPTEVWVSQAMTFDVR